MEVDGGEQPHQWHLAHITDVITSDENLPKEQIRQAHRQLRGWDFCQHPSTFLHPPPTLQTPCPTTHPPSDCSTAVWTTLDRKRGLTKVSMATVQSVNHAAADVSSPSLFPFSCSFFCTPQSLHNPPPPFPLTLPAYLFFLPPFPVIS